MQPIVVGLFLSTMGERQMDDGIVSIYVVHMSGMGKVCKWHTVHSLKTMERKYIKGHNPLHFGNGHHSGKRFEELRTTSMLKQSKGFSGIQKKAEMHGSFPGLCAMVYTILHKSWLL